MSRLTLAEGFDVHFMTPDDGHSYFFGYYDKSPLTPDNKLMLAHRTSFDGREVRAGDEAEVGYFDLDTGQFTCLGRTRAWNWQQGAQLQWVPGRAGEQVIYNDVEDGEFVARLTGLDGNCRTLGSPIYTLRPDGAAALTIRYERHYWCRPGYNYPGIVRPEWNRPWSEEDGIFEVDLQTGAQRRIVALADVIGTSRLAGFDTRPSWLEHMLFNPSGTRFMFFHRWQGDHGDETRCFTANADGSGLYLYPDTRFYSHADWKSDEILTIWSVPPRGASPLGMLDRLKRTPVLGPLAKMVYQALKPGLAPGLAEAVSPSSRLLDYVDGTSRFEVVDNGVLEGNGHQTWSRDRRRLLLDTYADANGYRSLLWYEPDGRGVVPVGRFFSTYNDTVYRADLHPRFSPDDSLIVVDSAHESRRKLVVIR